MKNVMKKIICLVMVTMMSLMLMVLTSCSKKDAISVEKVSYEGRYVDTQGTDTAYNDLQLRDKKDGTYACKINIYRLCQLEGTAKDNGNGKLSFVGNDPNDTVIKGEIEINGKYTMFTVTESNWNYLPKGESFKFMDKWDLKTAEAQGY